MHLPDRRTAIEALDQVEAWTLPPDAAAVPEARRALRACLVAWQLTALVDDALLLVSELVTNAVTHAGTAVELTVRRVDGALLVSVGDRYATRRLSFVPGEPDLEAEGHRGLYLLSELAPRWGVEYGATGKQVWFLLPVDEAADADAVDGDGGSTLRDLPRQLAGEPLGAAAGRPERTIDHLLDELVHAARDELDADAAYCYLAGDDDATFELRCTTGGVRPAPAIARVHAREGAASRLGEHLLPVVAQDTATERLPIATPDPAHRSFVAAPIVTRHGVVGVLYCASREPARFGTEHGVRLQRLVDARGREVDAARLVDLDRRRRAWLAYLAEASEMLSTTLDPAMTTAMLAQLVVPRLADWCVVHELRPDGRARLAHVWHVDEAELDGLRDAFADGAAITAAGPLTGTASVHELVSSHEEVVRVGLVARNRPHSALTLGRAGAPYGVDELSVVEDLARRAGLALDNARLHSEMTAVAATLQQSLLPPRLPELPHAEVAAAYRPSGRAAMVGGDFYDLFPIDDESFALAIGDVCGKGAQAATVTGLARHALRLLSRAGEPPATVLDRLNEAILDEGERSRFLTLLYAVLRPGPDGMHVTMCCAGHPLPLLVDTDVTADVTTVGTPQSLLGVLPELAIVPDEFVLAPGQTLLAYTDGVTERRNGGDMIGEAGLRAVAAANAGSPPAALVQAVVDRVASFADTPPDDDMAVLAIRVRAGG